MTSNKKKRKRFEHSGRLHSSIPYPDGWCKEDANTRISRDVFLYKEDVHTGELCFLCKSWKKGEHHRVKTAYGNAFGSFVCRPPRNEKEATLSAPYIQDEFPLIWTPTADGRALMVGSMLNKFLRTKQKDLEACLQANGVTRANPLAQVDTFVFQIPSKEQYHESSMGAQMTCIAKFINVSGTTSTSDDDDANGFCWVNEKKAKTEANIHGCVIHDFLVYTKKKTTGLFLKEVYAHHTADAKTLNGSNIVSIQQHVQDVIDRILSFPISFSARIELPRERVNENRRSVKKDKYSKMLDRLDVLEKKHPEKANQIAIFRQKVQTLRERKQKNKKSPQQKKNESLRKHKQLLKFLTRKTASPPTDTDIQKCMDTVSNPEAKEAMKHEFALFNAEIKSPSNPPNAHTRQLHTMMFHNPHIELSDNLCSSIRTTVNKKYKCKSSKPQNPEHSSTASPPVSATKRHALQFSTQKAKVRFGFPGKTKYIRELFEMDDDPSRLYEPFEFHTSMSPGVVDDKYSKMNVKWHNKNIEILYKRQSIPWLYNRGKHGEISLFFDYMPKAGAKPISIGMSICCHNKKDTDKLWNYFHYMA